MCGIVAYKGPRSAGKVLLDGLRILEYRGYDSVGVAVSKNNQTLVLKDIGNVQDVDNKLSLSKLDGNLGIAHTRWSTHGEVTKLNAHPHLDCTGRISIVHNGIVENFQTIRSSLGKHKLISDTDTELIAHLIEDRINLGLKKAVLEVANMLKGRSAFVVMDSKTNTLIAARKGTPLIVGVGENEYFIASDINAFLGHTNKVMYLDDEELVEIIQDPIFYDLNFGHTLDKRIVEIDWKPDKSEKGVYSHFLIKEIMEQKQTIYKAINQDDIKIKTVAEDIGKAYGTFIIGCGTAGKVCNVGEYLFSKVAKKHVNAYIASEFPNYSHYLTPRSLVIAVSQSGETADVLEAIDAAKKKGSRIISLLNVFGSTMMRASDEYFIVNAGAERAVVSTKATTAQLAVLTLLSYAVAGKLAEGKLLLLDVAESVNDMLNPRYEAHLKSLAEKLKDFDAMYLIGRSLNYPIAMEAAIKLQETAYINAQGFAGGELKHGPLALIDKGSPCIVFTANDSVRDETISNAMEIRSRGGYIIGVSPQNNDVFDFWIKVPDAGDASPIVNIIPIQILAYHLALLRGCDPDKPKNLAKAVTTK